MPVITTLETLKTNVAWALVRTDFTEHIATSVPLAEAWLNRNLRMRTMEWGEPLVSVAGSRFIPLPADFLEPLGLSIVDASGRTELRFLPAGFDTSESASRPAQWTCAASHIAFPAPCDAVYTFEFRMLKRFALAAEVDTNPLLDSWPDLYLYAVLTAVCATHLTDDPRLAVWKAGRDELLVEVNRKEARSKALTQLAPDDSFTQPSHCIEGFQCL